MASRSSTMSLAAGVLVLALASPAFAQRYVVVHEGFTPGSEAVVGRPSGILEFDTLLNRLPGTAKIGGQYIQNGPAYVQVPAVDGHLTTYFADKGLSSVLSEQLLQMIRDFLLHGETTDKPHALIYRPGTYREPRLLDTYANELYIPDDFKIGDLLAVLLHNQQIPRVLIVDEEYFRNHLESVEQSYVGMFRLSFGQRSIFIEP